MKIKLKTRALVVETRNREVAGGSLWAGRLLRQALSFYGRSAIEEQDKRAREACDILNETCEKLDENFSQGGEVKLPLENTKKNP